MLVSVMIPTRGRPTYLLESLESLHNNAIDPENVEYLLRMDDDDKDTLAIKDMIEERFSNIKIIVGPRYGGYSELHLFYNELAEISSGKFLYLWNDDAVMKTDGWDLIMDDYREKSCVLMTGPYYHHTNNIYQSSFPAMHRKIYEIIGHFAPHPHNDWYIQLMCKMFDSFWQGWNEFLMGAEVPKPTYTIVENLMDNGPEWSSEKEIVVDHDLGLQKAIEGGDQTFKDGQLTRKHRQPWKDEIIGPIKDDVFKLMAYFMNEGEVR